MSTIFDLLVLRIAASATIGPDDDLQTAADKLSVNGVGALVVLDKGDRLVGLLTEGHIVRAMSTLKQKFPYLTVQSIMSTEVHTCHSDQSELELIKAMTERNVRYMAVVVGERVVGLVSLDELVKQRIAYVEQLHGRVAQSPGVEDRTSHLIEHDNPHRRIFACYRIWNDLQSEFGMTDLDERAKHLLWTIGEAESSGSPIRFRELMKQQRWGTYPTIRRSMHQLIEAGLVEHALDPDGRSRRFIPSERGRKLFERFAMSTLATRERGAQDARGVAAAT